MVDLTIAYGQDVDLESADVTAIAERIERWQQLFAPGADTYSLAGYEDLYVHEEGALLAYDNYAETDTRWLGFDSYRRTWEREINQNFPGFVMYLIEVDRIRVSGDLAWSAFTWFGRVDAQDGHAWPAQHATHGWRRIEGRWRIEHEHLTSGVKEFGRLLEHERRRADSFLRVRTHSRGAATPERAV